MRTTANRSSWAVALGLSAAMAMVHCGSDRETTGSTGSGGASSASSSASSSSASGGAMDAGDGGPCQSGAACNGSTGLCAPIAECSVKSPCQGDAGTQTTSIELPTCKTTNMTHPMFDDGPPDLWADTVNGEQRAACIYRPPGASANSKRPLVIFLHGSSGSADDVYNLTLLRQKAINFDLTGDPQRPGFLLAADQGRILPNPNGNLGPVARHDIYFRDLGSPSGNPDVRAIDRLVDKLVAEGAVDPSRIYMVGWSNGAFFSQLYVIARFGVATPGGSHVAGAIAYAGGDPFQNISNTETPSCQYAPYPTSKAAIGLFHRACDAAVGCDAAQQQKFSMPPGYDIATWAQTLGGAVGDPNVLHQIINGTGQPVATCSAVGACTSLGGLSNHVRWPDGLAQGDTQDWEGSSPGMLQFLRDHPHP